MRLQALVIGDARFVTLGLRREGGFVGEHDRTTRMPILEHVSARPDDLPSLIDGLIECEREPARTLDPVIAAAIIAFGFVYIHPFEDGNGRIHRYLVHHVLARHGFTPAGIVFPVSAAILERIDVYRAVLESYSARLLPVIEWRPTPAFNVDVVNDTSDFYRFFDATPHASFRLRLRHEDHRGRPPGRDGLPAELRHVPNARRRARRHAGANHRPPVPVPPPERRSPVEVRAGRRSPRSATRKPRASRRDAHRPSARRARACLIDVYLTEKRSLLDLFEQALEVGLRVVDLVDRRGRPAPGSRGGTRHGMRG